MKRIIKKHIMMLASPAIALMLVTDVFAAAGMRDPGDEGKTQAELNGYTDEEWNRLMDDTLEYSEIPDLVHCFNPSVSSGWDLYADSYGDIKSSADLLTDAGKQSKNYYNSSKQQYERMSAYMTPAQKAEAEAGLAALKASSDAAETMASTLNNTYKKMQRSSSYDAALRKAEKQLTSAVRQVMCGYRTVLVSRTMLEQLAALYSESVNAYAAMLSTGAATPTDLMKAQNDLIQAQANLAGLSVTERQLYEQMITLCGWKAGDTVNIGEIPVPDAVRLAAFDPEKDITAALGNNYSLWDYRDKGHDHTSTGLEVYFAQEAETEAKIRIELDKLKAGVISAQQAYESALAGRSSAQLTRRTAETQYDLGLMSRVQYLGTRITAVQKEAAYASAGIALEQAASAYEDAVAGLYVPD